jgi:hypothetical protein
MIRVFEYKCADGHLSEAFVEPGTTEIACKTCGKPAFRVISMPRVRLDPISGHFPSALGAWERRREEKMAVEQRNLRNHGVYGDGAWERDRGTGLSIDSTVEATVAE